MADITTYEPTSDGYKHVRADALEAALRTLKNYIPTASPTPVYDESAQEYTNSSILAWLNSMSDPNIYGINIPVHTETKCTKIANNAGIPAPTPGVLGTPCVDPYVGLPTFFHIDVNATVDENGVPHVHAIEGDGNFRRSGSNGNVFVLAPVIYWKSYVDQDGYYLFISKNKQPNFNAQPGAYYPGTNGMRPYMLYAKYGWGGNSDYSNVYSSSGVRLSTDYDHYIWYSLGKSIGDGYSCKNHADDWYVKVMFMMKYATKNSQSVFAGCTSYDFTCNVSVAQDQMVRSVIVSNEDAEKFIVNSSVRIIDPSLPEETWVAKDVKIESKEAYDENNTELSLNTIIPGFTSTTSFTVSPGIWWTGCTDLVEGDGSVLSNTNGMSPFKIQGIEMSYGAFEVLNSIEVHQIPNTGPIYPWWIRVITDSKKDSAYNYDAAELDGDDSTGFHYTYRPSFENSYIAFGSGLNSATDTGMCDSSYLIKYDEASSKQYQWLSYGDRKTGTNAGLWCIDLSAELETKTDATCRLSALGRSKWGLSNV